MVKKQHSDFNFVYTNNFKCSTFSPGTTDHVLKNLKYPKKTHNTYEVHSAFWLLQFEDGKQMVETLEEQCPRCQTNGQDSLMANEETSFKQPCASICVLGSWYPAGKQETLFWLLR